MKTNSINRILCIIAVAASVLYANSLHQAAGSGDLEAAKNAISKGIDVNAKDKKGKIALILAIDNYEGYIDIVKFLIKNGANVNAKDENGKTALMYAANAYKGNLDIVKLLVDNGADINAKDKDESNVLHWVAHSENTHIAKFLIEKGLDVNAIDKDGFTALHIAALLGHFDMARFFIANGADVNAKNKNGFTELYSAAMTGILDMARFFIANGADVNAKSENGETALMMAALLGNLNMAKLLVANDANIQIKNKDGKTALMIAKEKGNLDIVEKGRKDIVKLLTSDYESVLKTISITGVEFANTDKNNKIIDSYGSKLNETRLKYLTPRITYDNSSSFEGNKVLYVKIIEPNGNLKNGSSSPSGFSYSKSIYVNSNTKEKIELSGWGNDDGGVYDGGVYTFEVWSDGKKLYSSKFTVSAFNITGVKFANSDGKNNIIGSYGTYFESSKLKYLKPSITYNNMSSFAGRKDLYVRIIKPDGNLKTGSSSPTGFSYSSYLNLESFGKGEATLDGWGNDDGGSYNDGVHTFEIWSNNKKLYSTNFTVNNEQERIARQQEEQRRYEQQRREYERQQEAIKQEENMEELINTMVGLAGAIDNLNKGNSQQQSHQYQYDNSYYGNVNQATSGQDNGNYQQRYDMWERKTEKACSALDHQDKGKVSYNMSKKNLRNAQREMRNVRNQAKSNGVSIIISDWENRSCGE